MTSEHIAELLLSEELNTRMDGHGILVWCLLFAIPFDPNPMAISSTISPA